MADPVTDVRGRACEEGNACRIDFVYPESAKRVRVLRKVGSDPSAVDDATAVIVLDAPPINYLSANLQGSEAYLVDHGFQKIDATDPVSLVNGTAYHYAIYVWDGSAYSDPELITLTPKLAISYVEPNTKKMLMERIETTMRALYGTGAYAFKAAAQVAEIKVFSTYPRVKECTFPLVSVHRDGEQEAERFLGDNVGERDVEVSSVAAHEELRGRVRRVRFAVLGWTMDSGERDELTQLMNAAIRANVGLFSEMGFADVIVSGSDAEDFMTFDAPMYYSVFDVSGLVLGATGRQTFDSASGYEPSGDVDYQDFDK